MSNGLASVRTPLLPSGASGGGSGAKMARRVLAVGAMVLGAIVGALLLQIAPVAPLAVAAVLLAVVSGTAYRASRARG
jgi:hypothetical protein